MLAMTQFRTALPLPQKWRIVVHARAQRVFLNSESPDGVRSWHEMTPRGNDRWLVELRLDPRGCRFSYCILDGSTLINCGARGLSIEPLLEDLAAPDRSHHPTGTPLDATRV
jgi:hypothetical protein